MTATLKQRILQAVDEHADEIRTIADTIYANPELGYKEEKTGALVQEIFRKIGLSYRYPVALTGAIATLKTGREGVSVCVIGEMDAVTATDHSCGHHVQMSTMLGVAMVLAESGILEELSGEIHFLAAPAEEFTEIEFRQSLVKEGKITYLGGKQQLIAEGVFDGIDMAMMLHAHANCPTSTLHLDGSSLGFRAKTITFFGKEAHGSEPFNGINALNAAMMTLMGIHANRETFRDEDRIRIHPIITQGGDIVNVVPAHVIMETFVRGARAEAIEDACEKVDRAAKGAAYAVGATCEISDIQGYLPLKQDAALSSVMEECAAMLKEDGLVDDILHGINMTGSTDMGDLTQIMPAIQPTLGGYSGALHSKDFSVADERVYTTSVKLLALTVAELLCNGAACGKKIKQAFPYPKHG